MTRRYPLIGNKALGHMKVSSDPDTGGKSS